MPDASRLRDCDGPAPHAVVDDCATRHSRPIEACVVWRSATQRGLRPRDISTPRSFASRPTRRFHSCRLPTESLENCACNFLPAVEMHASPRSTPVKAIFPCNAHTQVPPRSGSACRSRRPNALERRPRFSRLSACHRGQLDPARTYPAKGSGSDSYTTTSQA